MTRRKKNFKELRSPVALPHGITVATLSLTLAPGAGFTIDLSSWLGKGLDGWVHCCIGQLQAFVENKSVSLNSVISYGKALKYFFAFIDGRGGPMAPEKLQPGDLASFVEWLKMQRTLREVSMRSIFTHVKAVMVAMRDRGLFLDHDKLFPANPFAQVNRQKKGATSLSTTERARLADALRRDIIGLHAGELDVNNNQALTVYALALAMRTGLNTSPLLELARDSLRPHPFLPRMRLLRAYKRRGNATHIKSLRYQRTFAAPASVPMDGVALFEEVLSRTQALAQQAPAHLKNRIWLYTSQARRNAGEICYLSESMFTYNVSLFVRRHGLLSDDGLLLVLNTSRLRKTMENRLWRLSNGDLFTVAAIMGHTPAVADQSYLAVTDEMRRNAAFVGETLPGTYRSGGESRQAPRLERTPVGNCSDSLHGERAPGNGTHCTDFLSCFGCRSFAIVGEEEDLHRLFSFYWFLEAEGRSATSREWKEHFIHVRTQIDAFTLDKFDEMLVERAKQKARVSPLKFWSLHKRLGGSIHAGQ